MIVTVWNSIGLKLPDLAIVKIKIKTSHRKTSTLTIHFSPIVPAFTIQTPKAQLSMWYTHVCWNDDTINTCTKQRVSLLLFTLNMSTS